MTYGGIDRKRFRYLLSLGTDDAELKRFFANCRLQLIQHGGRVQNLPYGSKGRIRALAIELPPSTDEVVRGWFAEHLTMVDPEEAEAIVEEFKTYEELGEQLPEDSARRLARSCLVHLFAKDLPQMLLDFLKTPIGGQFSGQEDAIEIADIPSLGTPGASYPDNLPQVLVDLVERKDADEHLEGLPPELVAFISGLQSGARGDMKEAREALDALPADSAIRSRLERFVRQQEARKASKEASSRGLRILEPELFEGSFDYELDEVLAYCVKADKQTAVFVHPIAVIAGGRIQLLTAEKRRELFPETGDVIAFVGTGYPPQPRRGEIGVWRVAERQTHKPTRFHLASQKRPVYEVRKVPFASTDYDSVREFLKEYTGHSGGRSLQSLLFLLEDGLIVGGRGERMDFSKDETFESGLLSWDSLLAFRHEGRLLVAGPLPKEQGIYECAGLASTVRKLFKPRVGKGKAQGGLTRAELSDLAQSLGSDEAGLDMRRVQRIRAELERLGEQQEAFDALMEEVMNHPSVKQQIDQRVEQEASRQLNFKNKLQADIDRLQKAHEEWEERVRKQNDEYGKLPHGISKRVKAAFERARADGLSTLAELAVFQALSEPTQAPHAASEHREDSSRSLAQPIVRDLLPSDSDPVAILKSLGIAAQRATAFSLVANAARRAGLMVCVRGVAARPAVEAWARAVMRRGVLLDTTVGLVDDAAMRDVLAKAPDGVALLDANLSALDIYARPLSDLVLARLAEPTSDSQLAIFLGLADSVAALPLPKTFERISLMVDLDARYVFRDVSEIDELMSEVVNPDDGTLYVCLWRPAADRLRRCIDEMEPQQRALVLSLLVSQ